MPGHVSTQPHHALGAPPFTRPLPLLLAPRTLLCSNATLLDAAVGGSVDGVLVSEEYPYAKAFTVSAAEDPGGAPAGGVEPPAAGYLAKQSNRWGCQSSFQPPAGVSRDHGTQCWATIGLFQQRHVFRPPSRCPAGALNRAEWIKFVALFFNLEKNASDIYDAIQARYEATKVGARPCRGCSVPAHCPPERSPSFLLQLFASRRQRL